MELEPITREEMYLAAAAGQDVTPPEPITRKEMFLAQLAGMEVDTPVAYTRSEMFLAAAGVAANRAVISPLEITENGTYEAPEGVDGYSPVTVNVETTSPDVRYVTFMNHDGTVELGKKAVAVGDDCADPIARGIIDTPTKESDVQYDYTFSGGWATEPGGGIDADALKNVTEDRTVYANFIAAVRYYTITYYDSDGKTVLKTETLAYGATPSYKPSKEGYKVGGWIPEITAVTGDAGYTVQWEELSGLYLQSKASNVPYSAYDFVITNDGKHIVYTVYNTSLTNLNGFDTSAEVATSILLSPNGVAYQGYIDILGKNDYIMMLGGDSSGSGTGRIITTSFNGGVNNTTPQLGGLSAITCSPTSDLYCYRYYKSGEYIIRFSDNYEISLSDLSSTYLMNHGRITKDDKHFVCAASSRPIGVYDISERSAIVLKKSITPSGSVNSLAVSSDGTKMLFATNSSPYVEVYSLETYEKICDFSGILTGSAYATFAGDLVVTAQGSTVRAFEIVDSAPVEFFNIPAYSGGTVSCIESSHNGNFVAIYSDSSDQFEVWGKA